MIRDIPAPDRAAIAPLFSSHRHLRVLVDAILQGHCGTAVAGPGPRAEVAQLAVGPFIFFGGDPIQPAARTLVGRLSGERIIVSAGGGWREAILRAHGERAGIEKRLAFSSANLDLAHLRPLTARIPEGFQIERLTVDLARRIRAEVDPDLLLPEIFASPSDFVARGVGFCAVTAGHIVCAATSAFICDGAIEIQINTNSAYRSLGLATAVAANLLVHCLERGIDPHWDTGDPASERVAEKLGYLPESAYEWLLLHGET
jgi:hypothetical protein